MDAALHQRHVQVECQYIKTPSTRTLLWNPTTTTTDVRGWTLLDPCEQYTIWLDDYPDESRSSLFPIRLWPLIFVRVNLYYGSSWWGVPYSLLLNGLMAVKSLIDNETTHWM
ncbi:hypothetical protein AKO1_007224, partial [Acrasis kona]